METTRFETFFDAIIAIIITVLVFKLPQPATPTLEGVLELNAIYIAYLISFLVLYNIWYSNHELFHLVDTIDNAALAVYGMMTFTISLLPYFTIWVANNFYSIAPQTMFGVIFLVTHILNTVAFHLIKRANPYGAISEGKYNDYLGNVPAIVILLGFVLTYTIYRPGIYVTCLVAVIMWIVIEKFTRRQTNGH